MKIAKFILIFLFIIISNKGYSSPQRPDYVIYKNDTIPVYNLILEQYLEKSNKGSLFGLEFRSGASFNCWRGYQAIYKIENDSLFLNNIIDCGEYYNKPIDIDRSNKRIKEIFKNKVRNGKVHLDWYTGEFSLPNGKLLRWDGIFHKTFENEILIKVEKGKIIKISEIENYIDEPNRINRKYKDTISNVIFNELVKNKLNKKKKFDKFDCYEAYLITINEKGVISDITMFEYPTNKDIKDMWKKSEYNYCIRTMRKKLKKLKFDILKKNGKPIIEKVYIEIWLDEKSGELENWTD